MFCVVYVVFVMTNCQNCPVVGISGRLKAYLMVIFTWWWLITSETVLFVCVSVANLFHCLLLVVYSVSLTLSYAHIYTVIPMAQYNYRIIAPMHIVIPIWHSMDNSSYAHSDTYGTV